MALGPANRMLLLGRTTLLSFQPVHARALTRAVYTEERLFLARVRDFRVADRIEPVRHHPGLELVCCVHGADLLLLGTPMALLFSANEFRRCSPRTPLGSCPTHALTI